MCKILVVTPTLGDRSTLSKTIASVRDIGRNNVKHIIIAPPQALADLSSKYKEVSFMAEEGKSKGIYSALNQVFFKYGREYDYITFINDDDYWLPDFRLLIDTILEDRELDFVYGKTAYIDKLGHKIAEQASSKQYESFLSLLRSDIVLLTQQATLVKSKFFFKIGGFDQSYKLAADTKFWLELSLLKPRYKYIDKICAAYMVQDGQLSSNKTLARQERTRLLASYAYICMPRFRISVDRILFRIYNLKIYVKRLLGGHLHNPLK